MAANDINGYFLETDSPDVEGMLNKCITISGDVIEGWKNIAALNFMLNGIYTSGNSALENIKVIGEVPYENCTINKLLVPEESEIKTYQGIVREIERPAPDISYDYVLEFTKPQEIANAAGTPTIEHIVIMPTTIPVEKYIQETLGKIIELTGFISWGYAESTVFYITQY